MRRTRLLAAALLAAACAGREAQPAAAPAAVAPPTGCLACHKEARPAAKVLHAPYRTGACETCHRPHGPGGELLLVASERK
ncbi:MAG TPA: cytochrome c3 family protein, partial [Anaeromyxobacter sp.]|nr:cytochrome c3 family protein [Anaeromyxobacter sp.]